MARIRAIAGWATLLLSAGAWGHAMAAEETTFPLPGHELWGTWQVEAVEVPLLPKDIAIESLTGWKEALEIYAGLLPVGQTLEFRFVDDCGAILGLYIEPQQEVGLCLEMVMLEPIQPGVCLNGSWDTRCDTNDNKIYTTGQRRTV